MSSVVTSSVNIAGINGTVVQLEYTASSVFSAYQNDINTIQAILTKKDANNNIVPVSDADAKTLATALNDLKNLLTKGLKDPTTGQVSYMTAAMATQLDIVFRSLQSVGVNTGTSTGPSNVASTISFSSTDQAVLWQFVVNSSSMLQGVFAFADSPTSNQSLQSLIELQYVQTSNNLLSAQLSSLEGAVNTTQSSLNVLNTLQNLHNKITTQQGLGGGSFSAYIASRGGWNPPGLTADQFQTQYEQLASTFFGTITPAAPVATVNIPSWVSDIYTFSLPARVDSNGNPLNPVIFPKTSFSTNPNTPSTPNNEYNITFATPPGGFTLANLSQSFKDRYTGTIGGINYPKVTTNVPVSGPSTTTITVEANVPGNTGPFLQDDWTYFNPNSSSNVFAEILAGSASISITPQGSTLTVNSQEFTTTNNQTIIFLHTISSQITVVPNGGISQLITLRTMLSNQIVPALSAITPTLPGGLPDPTSLLAQIKQVLSDIKTSFVTDIGNPISTNTSIFSAGSGFTRWMLDRYNQSNTSSANLAGQYQQNITSAVTAAQSLNSTQSENVRNFLYVFEEYYKSADAILQKISQIIEQAAQNISK